MSRRNGGQRVGAEGAENARATLTVHVPGLLRSYTAGAATIELPRCATLGETMRALDARFPGIRFRIVDEQQALRPHIKFFVDGTLVRDLAAPMAAAQELMIVGALSGG